MRLSSLFHILSSSAVATFLVVQSQSSNAFALGSPFSKTISSSLTTKTNLFKATATATATTATTNANNNANNNANKKANNNMHAPPKPISVPPGTSPIEEQPKRNPINESCTILVIGASRGIGLEFVKQCLEQGASVYATHRSTQPPQSLLDVQKQFPNHSSRKIRFLQMDLESETSIMDAAKTLGDDGNDDGGLLTHIIHSAGIYLPGTSLDGKARGPRKAAPPVTKEIMMKTFEINTIAPLLIAQHFVPLLKSRSVSDGDGDEQKLLLPIISILSSKVGSVDDNGSGGAYAYRSSKSALNNIAKSLSIDLSNEARVLLLHPGYVRTDMTDGNGLIDVDESVNGMLNAIEATDATVGFRFVDYKACLIPW